MAAFWVFGVERVEEGQERDRKDIRDDRDEKKWRIGWAGIAAPPSRLWRKKVFCAMDGKWRQRVAIISNCRGF